MKTKLLLVIIFVGFLFSCQEEKKLDNPDQLKQVLTSYFDGIENRDFDKMKDVTTNDFVLFEDGKIWNNDSIINMLKAMPPFDATYKIDNFDINIDNENGNMFYFNHLDATLNDTTKLVYDWIESATFKKIDGEWKMNFLHSTVRK